MLGESTSSYDKLLASITAALQPRDIFEQIWVKDIADYTWEAQRMRIYKLHLCSLHRPQALKEAFLLLGVLPQKAEELAATMANKSLLWQYPEKVAELGLTDEMVRGLAVSLALREFEQFDRIIAVAETRRDAQLRNLERRRASADK